MRAAEHKIAAWTMLDTIQNRNSKAMIDGSAEGKCEQCCLVAAVFCEAGPKHLY